MKKYVLLTALFCAQVFALNLQKIKEGEYQLETENYQLNFQSNPFRIDTYRNNKLVLKGDKKGFFVTKNSGRRKKIESIETISNIELENKTVFLKLKSSNNLKVDIKIVILPYEYIVTMSTSFNAKEIGIRYDLAASNHWYGEGELAPRMALLPFMRGKRQHWPLSKSSHTRKLFRIDDNNAVLVPFWMTSTGAGIFVDTYDYMREEFNDDQDGIFSLAMLQDKKFRPINKSFTYSIIVKENTKEVYKYWVKKGYQNKQAWNPHAQLPEEEILKAPIWMTWTKFKKKFDQQILLDYARSIHDRGMPHGLLGIDDKWQSEYGDLEFDSKRFPDPEGMLEELKELGFSVSLWTLNFVHKKSKMYNFLSDKDGTRGENWLLLDKKGKKTKHITWWDSFYLKKNSGVLDFTNEDFNRWYIDEVKSFTDKYDIAGFKYDAGEARYLTNEFQSKKLINPNKYTDIYVGLRDEIKGLEYRAARFSQHLMPVIRQFDKNSSWDNIGGLKAVLTQYFAIGTVGYPIILPGVVGGSLYFMNDRSAELYMRWIQLNTFLPLMQISVLPWDRGDEAYQLTKRYLKIYQGLYQYKMNLVEHARKTGMPIVRPLFFEFPNDQKTYPIDDQFMYGEEILVAPILKKKKRSRNIYLPKGTWTEVQTNRKIEGPILLENYPVPLEEIPVFIRGTNESLRKIIAK